MNRYSANHKQPGNIDGGNRKQKPRRLNKKPRKRRKKRRQRDCWDDEECQY